MSVIHANPSVKGRVASLSIHRLGLYLFVPLSTTLRFSLLNCSLDGRSMGMSGSKPDRLPCGACALPVACWMRGSSPVSSYSTYRDGDISHTYTYTICHPASSVLQPAAYHTTYLLFLGPFAISPAGFPPPVSILRLPFPYPPGAPHALIIPGPSQ
jgi:hypothetical protein